ncbi:hypothetical protein Lpp77_10046, partial [Lacticaseibacillus paracasei subsp. paracasei CNCM I-4270]
ISAFYQHGGLKADHFSELALPTVQKKLNAALGMN